MKTSHRDGARRAGRCLFLALALGLALAGVALGSPLTTDYTPGSAKFRQGSGVEVTVRLGEHVPKVDYLVGTEPWQVSIRPDPPEFLEAITTNAFDVVSAELKSASGWRYASAATPLSDDSLVVRTYAARHVGRSVGANFIVEYVPHGSDPLIVHWIQVVTSNHPLREKHGAAQNAVDHRAAGPYYDQGGLAGPRFLVDQPRRGDNQPHEWTAELFLVTGPPVIRQMGGPPRPTPGPVTFYGGIRWGWENHCVSEDDPCEVVPEPAAYFILMAGLLLLWRRARVV
jgi:hypothetical protein